MYEIARRYPAPGLLVSTGAHPDGADIDGTLQSPVDRLPLPPKRLRTLQGLLLWARRSAVLARAHRARFIWCGDIHPAGYPAKWTLERVGTPFGVLLHGADLLVLQHQVHRSTMKRRTTRALLGSAAVLVANSEWTRGLARSLLRELELDPAEDRVRMVPLGTDPDFFRPGMQTQSIRERYGLHEGRWLVSVSQLALNRGIDVVLRALTLLDGKEADVRYAIAGTGEARRELEQLILELGLDQRVRLLGGIPENELAGGVPETVRDGETGLLVEPDRPADLAEAIRVLLRDRKLTQRLGAAGRREIERYYNWDRVATDLARIAGEASQVRSER